MDNDGFFTGYMSTKGVLVRESDGSFTWWRTNGIAYTFSADMKFVAKTDGNGNTQTLTYNADGLLATVTDSSTGRSIGFVYNSSGRIDHITGPVTEAVPDGVWVSYEYDVNGNLIRVTYADEGPSGFEYKYQDAGDVHNLTEKRNLAGEFLASWTYDTSDRAVTNVTRDGKGVQITYGTSQVTVTDAQGVASIYTLATIGGHKSITNISGGSNCASCGQDVVRYGYDDKRRVTEVEHANGRIDRYSDFDETDRYRTEIRAAGTDQARTFLYTYHPDTGEILSIIEESVLGSGNKETIFDYDSDGNSVPNEHPTRRMYRKIERGYTYNASGSTAAYEYVTTYAYDARGRMLSEDGPLAGDADKITYTYDSVTGDRLTETHSLIGTVSYGYDAAGNVTSVTDAAGVLTTVTYDGKSRVLSSTRSGVTESRAFTVAGEVDTVTDALNRTLDYTYNTAGFLEKIVEPSGDYLFYGYNTTGRPVEESLHMASGARTFYRGIDYGTASNNPAISSGKPRRLLSYNQAGTALTATTFTYDSPGNLTGMADAKGNVTSYHYDLFKRPDRMTQPGDTVTVYTYDRHGNLATVRDAQENVTGYIYDDLGRLLETLSPDTGTTRYSYDEAGNLRFRIQNGKTEEYRYDVLGRLTQILSSDASRNVTLTYDTGTGSNLLGRLASVTDGSGTTRYSYDVQGRVISETKTIASETYVTSYGYDAAGNLRSITYPTGQTVQYVADTSDPAKISGVKLNPAGANLPLASSITYLPFGPASNILLGNTVAVAKGYDQNYRLSDVYQANGHTVMDQAYTLDDIGNVAAIADDLDPTRSKSFGYDALARLTGATGIYGTLAYTYDKAGNRLTETKSGVQDTYDYFPYTSRLRSVTGTHAELISYDEDGNITSRTPGAGNPTPAVTSPSDYVYNAGGQRVMKTKNGAATVYHYDLEGRLIAETDDEGTLKQAYVWLNGEPLAMIGADGSVYYYHNDHLGTPQALTDQAVNLVWSADYLPFGQASVTTATVVNNLRFPGQYFDAETGLHYNDQRYYDPKLGRYITPDPIGLAGGVNLYSYVQNNPVNFVDPYGLKGGILTPIRKAIQRNVTPDDVFSSVAEEIMNIPLTPLSIFLTIMAPTEAGESYEEWALGNIYPSPIKIDLDPNPMLTQIIKSAEEKNPKLTSNQCDQVGR